MTVTDIRQMTDREATWLAALLEGEGCFDAQGTNPRIRVKMTDLDVVLRAATIMGCSYYADADGARRGHKMAYVAQVTGPRAAHVMRSILPDMGIRRSQKIVDLLAGYEARKKRGAAALALVALAA